MKKFYLSGKVKRKAILASVIIASLAVPFPLKYFSNVNNVNSYLSANINKTSSNVLSAMIQRYKNSYGVYAASVPGSPGAGLPAEPIVLDLNYDRETELTSIEDGIYFDFNADGYAEKISWADQKDGVLAIDLNNNGKIDNGNEIIKDDDSEYSFRKLDSNKDGRIGKEDNDFDKLIVMRKDGTVQTLKELNIDYISTKTYKEDMTDEYGNYKFGTGGYATTDGKNHLFDEYYFAVDLTDTKALNTLKETRAVSKLPEVLGKGTLPSLHQAMLKDNELVNLVKQFSKEKSDIKRQELVNQILLKWTGADKAKDNSQQVNIIAKKILGEEASGTKTSLESVLQQELVNNYEIYLYAQLMRQTHLKNVIKLIKYNNGQYDFSNLVKYVDKLNIKDKDNYILELAVVLKGLGMDKNSNFLDPADDNCFYLKFIAKDRDTKWKYDSYGKIPYDEKNPVISKNKELMGTLAGDSYNAKTYKIDKNKKLWIHSFHGDDTLYGADNMDTFVGCLGDDILDGGAGNDDLHGFEGNDIIFGGAGDDKLFGGDDNDIIFGGAGNDIIYTNHFDEKKPGESGNNIVRAGEGNDIIYGDNGNDTYIFFKGDGNDIITEVGGDDTLYFGEGITWNDLKFNRTKNDLLIKINNDSITIKDWYNSKNQAKIEVFKFADGTIHRAEEVK